MVGSAEPFRVGWQGAVCRTGGARSEARREIPGDDRFHRVHRGGDAGTGPGEKTFELAPARQFKAVEQIAADPAHIGRCRRQTRACPGGCRGMRGIACGAVFQGAGRQNSSTVPAPIESWVTGLCGGRSQVLRRSRRR